MVAGEGIEGEYRVFRLRRYYLYVGLAGLVLFFTMTVICLLADMDDVPADRRTLLAIISTSISGLFTVSSLWLILSYFYATLIYDGFKIIFRGVLLRKELDLERVRQLRWIGGGAGIIKLKTLTEKGTIYLDNFAYEDRLWIVERLRNQAPESHQEGWDLFCHRIAMPLRRYDPQTIHVPDKDEVLLTRKRWDWLLLPFILLTVVFGLVAAWKFGLPRMLTAPVLPTALWLFLRYSTPRKGMVARKLSADPEQNSQLAFFGWFLLVYMLIQFVNRFVNFPWLDESTVSISVSVFGICVLFWRSYQFDKANHQKRLEASKTAVKEWEARQKTDFS